MYYKDGLQFVETKDQLLLHIAIRIVFQEDYDLLDKYHILKGQSLSICVKDTFEKIIEANSIAEMSWYLVYEGENIIGYVVVSPSLMGMKVLYSFGLNKDYRRKYGKRLYDWVKSVLGDDFFAWLWSQNFRAIKYLQRQGMKVMQNENQITILCQ